MTPRRKRHLLCRIGLHKLYKAFGMGLVTCERKGCWHLRPVNGWDLLLKQLRDS